MWVIVTSYFGIYLTEVGQGNVFTRVCHSLIGRGCIPTLQCFFRTMRFVTTRQWGCVGGSRACVVLFAGVPLWVICVQEGLPAWGSLWRGLIWRGTETPQYWNLVAAPKVSIRLLLECILGSHNQRSVHNLVLLSQSYHVNIHTKYYVGHCWILGWTELELLF